MKNLLIILLFLTTGLLADIGTIMASKGSAVVQRVSGDLIAKSGLSLLEGDTIVTKAKSRVQVMLKDETVVTIGAKSTFSFDEYSFDGANSKVAMRSSRGFFRSVTGKIGKLAPQRFKVKTASATIGIRGTDFWGKTGGKREKITCNKGVIVVKFDGGEREIGAGRYINIGPKGDVKEGNQGDDNGDEADEEGKGSDEEEDGEGDDANSGLKILEDAISIDGQTVNINVEDIADVLQGINEITEPFGAKVNGEDRPEEY